MLIDLPKPTQTALVFVDTSVLVDYLVGGLSVPGFAGLLEKVMWELVNDFKCRGVRLRITPTIKGQIKYEQDRIRRKAMATLDAYLYSILEAKVRKRYYELEQRLVEENLDAGRLPEVQTFYKNHIGKGDFVKCRQSKQISSSLPEESDMKILSEIITRPQSYLLTADCDFHSLDEEIAKEFQVFVISQENKNRVKSVWGWN